MDETKEFLLKAYKDTTLTLTTYKSAVKQLNEQHDHAASKNDFSARMGFIQKIKSAEAIIDGLESRKDVLGVALNSLTDEDYRVLTVSQLKDDILEGCFFKEEDEDTEE